MKRASFWSDAQQRQWSMWRQDDTDAWGLRIDGAPKYWQNSLLNVTSPQTQKHVTGSGVPRSYRLPSHTLTNLPPKNRKMCFPADSEPSYFKPVMGEDGEGRGRGSGNGKPSGSRASIRAVKTVKRHGALSQTGASVALQLCYTLLHYLLQIFVGSWNWIFTWGPWKVKPAAS